jgi:hypothetical protein
VRPVVRLLGLGMIAYGLSRGWQALQEWALRLDLGSQAEADLVAARERDAQLVGERADAAAISVSGASSSSRGRAR